MTKRKRTERGVLRSRAQVEVLVSPVRQEIIDTIESLGGEAAVADIAEQLGRPADGIYYHLRQLVSSGLLEELQDPKEGAGRRYRTAAPRGSRLMLRYSRDNVEAVSRVAAGLLRMARRDFDRALRSGKAVTEGDQRDLRVARGKGWVGDADIREINRLLARLSELLQLPRDARRNRLVSLAYVLAPLKVRPLRRR